MQQTTDGILTYVGHQADAIEYHLLNHIVSQYVQLYARVSLEKKRKNINYFSLFIYLYYIFLF